MGAAYLRRSIQIALDCAFGTGRNRSNGQSSYYYPRRNCGSAGLPDLLVGANNSVATAKNSAGFVAPYSSIAVSSPAATLALSFSYSLLSTRAQALYLFFRRYQGSSVARTGATSALPSSKSSWCANS